jgi:hypothetical protein
MGWPGGSWRSMRWPGRALPRVPRWRHSCPSVPRDDTARLSAASGTLPLPSDTPPCSHRREAATCVQGHFGATAAADADICKRHQVVIPAAIFRGAGRRVPAPKGPVPRRRLSGPGRGGPNGRTAEALSPSGGTVRLLHARRGCWGRGKGVTTSPAGGSAGHHGEAGTLGQVLSELCRCCGRRKWARRGPNPPL